MKSLKHTVLLLITISGLMAQFVVLAPAAHAALAVPDQEACFTKYNGHGSGRSTDGKLTSGLAAKYSASKCDGSKGGNCQSNGSSQGVIITCTNPGGSSNGTSGDISGSTATGDVGGVTRNTSDCKETYKNLTKDNCGIVKIISTITTALSSIAALVIIMMIIAGGVQYSSAGSDPSKVQAAKQKIANAILALFLLIFGFSILQWLVPGGIF